MAELFRFGVSLDKALLDKFDRYIRERNYSNRSEAFRDLIRQELIKKEWNEGDDVAGAITLIYDHHRRDLLNKITDLQHDFQKVIISTQHIHLDQNRIGSGEFEPAAFPRVEKNYHGVLFGIQKTGKK
jgi:CopG family nickel-responsive transcriptional regulator